MDKEKVIEEYLKNNLNKSKVAKLLGVSRERIGQIIAEIYGRRNPLVNYAGEINWRLFNDIKGVFGMSTNKLAIKAGCTPDAVRHILTNDKRWSKNHNRSASNASVKLGKAILSTAEKKLEKLVTTLDKLEEQI